jgi:hypothetical protein
MVDPNKTSQLQQLSNQLPVANARVLKQQQAARDIQLQQAIGAAPTTIQVPQVASQLATATAATAGKEAVATAAKQVQEQGQLAGMAIQQQAQAQKQQVASAELSQGEKRIEREKQLSAISQEGKRELYDANMKFAKDKMNREVLNSIQLDDWAVTKARNAQEFQTYSNQMEQLVQKDQQVIDHQFKVLSQEKQQQAALGDQLAAIQQNTKLTKEQNEAVRNAQRQLNDSRFKIAQKEAAISKQIRDKQASAANRRALGSAIGSVVLGTAGAVGGFFLSGMNPLGAVAGAQAGVAAGGAIGSSVS